MSDEKIQDDGREVMERFIARGLVIGGGVFWAFLAMGTTMLGPYKTLIEASVKYTSLPLITAAVILAIGWRYERLAGILLFLAAIAVIAYGAIFAWEMGVWLFMAAVLIGPMAMSATMYVLAAHNEKKRVATA
jgi:hypothetical protein